MIKSVCVMLVVLGMAGPGGEKAPRFRVLVFSKTAADGFRHDAIPAGVAAVEALGAAHDFAVEATEDAAVFTAAGLARFDAVLFMNTSGDVLDAAQQAAFEGYVRAGGGFVGVHGAAATEYDWGWYGGLVGAYFADHPAPQDAEVHVVDRVHPSTAALPARWRRFDEWYNYRTNPRTTVHVLATVAEKSYHGGTMGHDHPIVWAHRYDGGRAWYTGLGHTPESYADPAFRAHLLGGIAWAAGAAEGDAGATLASSYEKVVLSGALTDPMELAVAADGRVFVAERHGAVKVWNPEDGRLHTLGWIPVYMVIEDGLLGLTLDPSFDTTGWLYVYYAPADGGLSRLSRFTVADDRLDLASEKILLEVQVQRHHCCHAAGSLTFDPQGNLYLSTGDNSNPYDRNGPPIDERPGRSFADAQRSSGNTNDLRGKILRIHPEPDGTYTIPGGNLFPGDSLHRPEIYTMGHRNPFRISIDAATGWLYWGDVGNGDPPNERGGWGWDEFNQARGPGNFGWPQVTGKNQPYRDFHYTTGTDGVMGDWFSVDRPRNDSPNNTGARELPPAQPAMIWYTYGESSDFPEMGAGGINPMAGPVFHAHPATDDPRALPAYYEGKLLIYEWMRNWVKEVVFDEEGHLLEINPFLPGMDFVRPMDMEVGPDGRLYILEWGETFWGSNDDAQLVRLDYYGTPLRPPVAVAAAVPASGPAPLTVQFSSAGARNRNDDAALHTAWDFDGDGETDAETPVPAFTYEHPGVYTARLTVTDAHGLQDSRTVSVTAGNTAPAVAFIRPMDGGIFDFDAPISYAVRVTDPDAPPDTAAVVVQPLTGFDTHALPLPAHHGAAGTVTITRAYAHTPDLYFMDRYAELEARYRDDGGRAGGALEGTARIRLQPRHKEAEHVAGRRGATRKTYGMHPAAEFYAPTALTVMVMKDGDAVSYAPVNLYGIEALTFRLRRLGTGTMEVRLDAPDGPLLGTVTLDAATPVNVPETAQAEAVDAILARVPPEVVQGLDRHAYEGWTDIRLPVADPGGTHALFLVVTGGTGKPVLELDWLYFHGPALSGRPAGSPP